MKKLYNIAQHIKTGIKPYNNENGFILGAVILLSLMLALTVTIAIWSADNEARLVRNTGQNTQNFYDAETALVAGIVNQGVWMTNEFLSASPQTVWAIAAVDTNGDVKLWKTSYHTSAYFSRTSDEMAMLYIRPISSTPGTITGDNGDFYEDAKKMPSMTGGSSGGGGNGLQATQNNSLYSITAVTTAANSSGGREVIQIGISVPSPTP